MSRRLALALAMLLLLVAEVAARPWAWLGVRIRELSEHEMDEISARHGILEGYGVAIVEVLEGTPAARAGLKSGDVIVAFGEWQVTEVTVLQRMIANAPLGSGATVTVLRQDGRHPIDVRLATMPRDVAGDRVAAELGFAIRALGAPPTGEDPDAGVPSIAAVVQGGAAEEAGLQVGDVILEVGQHAVATRGGARGALADVRLDGPLRLTVRRDGRLIKMMLMPAEP